MRRPFATVTALALVLLPVAAFAQNPPAQPPAQVPAQPPAAAAPAQPAAPKLTFKSTSGMLIVQVKADQTAAFEEMMAKLKSAAASSTDEATKSQADVKVYKSMEPGAGGNAVYVLLYDKATPGTEYNWLDVINKSLTPDQQRDPVTRESYTKWNASVAAPMNQLNLVKVGGM